MDNERDQDEDENENTGCEGAHNNGLPILEVEMLNLPGKRANNNNRYTIKPSDFELSKSKMVNIDKSYGLREG